jgi:ABC-type glycerol-3-phosphate transport system permease component
LVLLQNIAVENVLWRNSKWASKAIVMTIAGLAAVWVAVPFLWAVDNSLKSDADIFRPGAIIPFLQFTPRLDMWTKVLFDPQLQKCLCNSAVVGVTSTLFVLLIGTDPV